MMKGSANTNGLSRWLALPGWMFGIAIIWLQASLGCSDPHLETWHTAGLSAEFTAEKRDEVQTFNDYIQLEARLFDQINEEVYDHVPTGPEYELFRFSSGSAADPRQRNPNWNRSFELPTESPVGGVLLLHGMSDSPYSLRALGETLNRNRYWVIGPRLPGHGTAPSGLKSIDWKDMAAVVRLCIRHLSLKVENQPIHIIGYSPGAALAIDFTLDALDGNASPMPASLILISPAIGIHPASGLAGLKNVLSNLPGLGRLAWLSIEAEFDPYKYNSFATNAGNQVHRVTRSVSRRMASSTDAGALGRFPSTLVFKSTVDATVSTTAVVDRLLRRLGPDGHELVLFDINRLAAHSALLVSDPGPLTHQLMDDATLPFTLTWITNQDPQTSQVVAHRKAPFSKEAAESTALNLAWPPGVISLSHVALPFPPDDPIYGQMPGSNPKAIFLGQMAIKGERGLLKIPSDWLLRLRHNPFYEFLEEKAVEWIGIAGHR